MIFKMEKKMDISQMAFTEIEEKLKETLITVNIKI